MFYKLFTKTLLTKECAIVKPVSRTLVQLCNSQTSKRKTDNNKSCFAKINETNIKIHNRRLHSALRRLADSQSNVHPPRRALLYVPGHDKRKIEKIPTLEADFVVLDCEDGVAMEKKEAARSTIFEVYSEIESKFTGQLGVRVNSPNSGLMEEDVKSISKLIKLPSTIVVPKINKHQELKMFCDLINQKFTESCHKPQHPCVHIILMTETAQGLINLKEIIEAGIGACSASTSRTKISGVIFGSDDFCADIGISRSQDSNELLYARQKIVTTAKAYHLHAIDMVYIDYKDDVGLRKQSIEGANMGFNGKQIIHPNQIPIVQESFLPSPDKVTWAKNLLEAYEKSKEGVFTFEGQMIDMPTILQAKNITEQYNVIQNKSKSET